MFFRFAPMGKVEKTRFEKNYTTFVNTALCVALKSPPKMVVWNRNFKIRFPWCFFVSPRWGKSKKRVLNKIIRPSSTRLYALLVKAHPKWCYETKVAKWWYSAHCALYTVHCTLCTVHYTRDTVLSALCTIHGTLYSVSCALYTVHCTLCTLHYKRYTVLCALCTIHSTLYSALYTVHCTLCPVH